MADSAAFRALLPDAWQDLTFQPFREGVEIFHLWQGEPAVALLRYAPGSGVPRHRHRGLETIIVLSGIQCDESGSYPAGSVVFNPAETEHSVWTDAGCTVLILWEKPVEFV